MKKISMAMEDRSISDLLKSFLRAKESLGVSPATIRSYEMQFQAIGRDLDLNTAICELRKTDLDRAVSAMRRRGLSPNSIKTYTTAIKAFLSWCNAEGLTELQIPLYKAAETIKEPYTDEELTKLLKKPNVHKCRFAEYRTWVIVNLLINSGCRAGTIRAMQIRDLDLEKRTIYLRHTKNGKAMSIPLCTEMCNIFREYLRYRRGQPDDYLFPNEYGRQMSPSVLRDAIRGYNIRHGVQKTSTHLFRHTFAKKYLLDCGGNAFSLQKLLGHSTLDMTRHYCAIYDADIAKNYDSFSPLEQMVKRKTRIK